MNISRFWTLIKKDPGAKLSGPVQQLRDVTILELTEDGMAYLWPVKPDRGELCLYCQTFRNVSRSVFACDAYRSLHCQPAPHPSYPCNFKESPDAEHQDLDSYLLDGDCKDAGGYFATLKEFLLAHDYPEQDLNIIPLGSFTGISEAREAWLRYLDSAM